MSGNIVQADYDELDAVARRFGQHAEAIGALRSRLEGSARALQQGGWQGRGAAAFAREMNGQLIPATQRLAHALNQASSVTRQIRELLCRAEQEAAAPFRGAAGGAQAQLHRRRFRHPAALGAAHRAAHAL